MNEIPNSLEVKASIELGRGSGPVTIELGRGSGPVTVRLKDVASNTSFLEFDIPLGQFGRLLGTSSPVGTGHTDDDPPLTVTLRGLHRVGKAHQLAVIGIFTPEPVRSDGFADFAKFAEAGFEHDGWVLEDLRIFNGHRLSEVGNHYTVSLHRYVDPGTELVPPALRDQDILIRTYDSLDAARWAETDLEKS